MLWSTVNPVLYLLPCVLACENSTRLSQKTSRDIVAGIKELCSDEGSFFVARKRFLSIPDEDVVRALVDVLKEDSCLDTPRKRTAAYQLLFEHKAGQFEEGYKQLLRGLDERSVRIQCVKGLVAVHPKHYTDVDARLATLLGQQGLTDPVRKEILLALAKLDTHARRGLAEIERIVRNQKYEESMRWAAVNATLHIRGLGETIKQFADLDEGGRKLVMWSLSRYILEKTIYGDSLSRDDVEHLQDAMDFAAQGVESGVPEVRKAGLDAFRNVYSYDAYIHSSRVDYGLAMRHRTMIERVAKDDPDTELREVAAKLLEPDFVHRCVEQYRRQKKRAQKSKGGPGD